MEKDLLKRTTAGPGRQNLPPPFPSDSYNNVTDNHNNEDTSHAMNGDNNNGIQHANGSPHPSTHNPNLPHHHQLSGTHPTIDYSPFQWNQYFDTKEDIPLPSTTTTTTTETKTTTTNNNNNNNNSCDERTFRVYRIRGGTIPSASASSSSQPDLPVFVLLHGAGHSALSWGLAAVCMGLFIIRNNSSRIPLTQ